MTGVLYNQLAGKTAFEKRDDFLKAYQKLACSMIKDSYKKSI
jgi:hypothetical protein